MENSYERGKVFGLEAFSDFPSDSLYGYHNTDFFISSFKGFLLSTRYQLRVRKLSSLMLPIFIFYPQDCFHTFPTGNQGCRAHW